MDTDKTKLAEIRIRNEFFAEFEGLVHKLRKITLIDMHYVLDKRRS